MSKLQEIVVPSLGESVVEASVASWFVSSNKWVEKDQALLELETDKATVEVVAPASGLLKVQVSEGETVPIGAVLGSIDTGKQKPPSSGGEKTGVKKKSQNSLPETSESSLKASASVKTSSLESLSSPSGEKGDQETRLSSGLKTLSPSQRKAVREGHLSLSEVSQAQKPGEGKGGGPEEEERKKMSLLRQKIAERLMHSQKSTATLTTFNEVDLTQVIHLRKTHQKLFQSRFGVKLGFMSFFVKALCYARREFPIVVARIEENEVIYPRHINVSVAVSTERGLVVPVLRRADTLSYAELETAILDMAETARQGKLTPDSMVGGNITLSNGGVFGSLLSTPILNPPQSAILGMHKTEMRPMAVEVSMDDDTGEGERKGKKSKEYKMEVRPMMYLALSYDHRLIDGRESVGFLVKVKEYLESVKESELFNVE